MSRAVVRRLAAGASRLPAQAAGDEPPEPAGGPESGGPESAGESGPERGGPESGPASGGESGPESGGTGGGTTRSGEVVLREPVDRPRLLRLAIRSETGSGADVARGVVAHIAGGYFLAGPPATPLHTVALWAGLAPAVLSVGCLPTEPVATVEVWPAREAVADLTPGPVTIERYGEVVTLTCGDSDGELVVDLVWADQ